MKTLKRHLRWPLCLLLCLICAVSASAQKKSSARAAAEEDEFGPIVRAYLGYLRNQQEVVDDRVSRREVDRAYYVRNSNRIRALRHMAVKIARETENDYLPELEAVTQDEFGLLFDLPPELHQLQAGEVLGYQLRFIGATVSGRDKFYVFARLDPYEQAELRKNAAPPTPKMTPAPAAATAAEQQPAATVPANTSRPRRATPPRR
ncbi:MAG TPA: hypothetical protein VF240_02835 [Pyrinomonadaceae bacterium]